MAKVMVDAKGNFVTTGGVDFLLNFEPAVAPEPDNDMIFGDLGNDWLVGGPGKDNLFGGLGNDLLNADDDHESGPDNTEVDIPPESLPADYYDDIVFGGGGRDVLIASSAGDIMIDWIGEFNSYVVPTSKFGPGTVIRYYTKAFVEFLYQLGISCGLDTTAGMRVPGADPARYFEPYGELGMVLQGDPIDQDVGAPRDPQLGNKGGKKK
ncbi:MAG: hypothetical protein GX112_15925 [Clostridiaceae bacterium]|nr:hypothetical protein [Clostridiaceae bacterium]